MPHEHLNKFGDLQLIASFFGGTATFMQPSQTPKAIGFFGGRCESRIKGASFLSKLHQVVQFENLVDCVNGIPLLFPFRHDGGFLSYRFSDNREIDILELDPPIRSLNWPYLMYPRNFPCVPIQIVQQQEMEYEKFRSLSAQNSLPEDDDNWFHLIVPPREDYGVSLWGELGDEEMVQALFSVNPTERVVIATNACD